VLVGGTFCLFDLRILIKILLSPLSDFLVCFTKFSFRVLRILSDLPDPKLGEEIENQVTTLEKLTSVHGRV